MLKKVVLNNFKCFEELEIELKPISVLCGVNSGGKSSIIQAILLGMEAIKKGRKGGNIDLTNLIYNVNLYSFEELLFDDANEDKIKVSLLQDDYNSTIIFKSESSDNNVEYQVDNIDVFDKIGIWYLGSDRMISQYQIRGNSEKLELGNNNEYIAFILELGRSNKIEIDKNRNCIDMENLLFSTQVNEWLDKILPGNQVTGITPGKDNFVSLKFGKEYKFHRTNIGYGVSFILPIIVSGLLAKKGDVLIVENPELHLHPKAQSQLTVFLSMLASLGVQVIVETHSDHIVNGMRKLVVDKNCKLKAEDYSIYFFDSKNNYKHITISPEAEFSDWPDDFMEQQDKDLYFIRKMRENHGI